MRATLLHEIMTRAGCSESLQHFWDFLQVAPPLICAKSTTSKRLTDCNLLGTFSKVDEVIESCINQLAVLLHQVAALLMLGQYWQPCAAYAGEVSVSKEFKLLGLASTQTPQVAARLRQEFKIETLEVRFRQDVLCL